MSYRDWKVGDRVVCVDDEPHDRYSPWAATGNNLDGLKKGRVYTIRKIGLYSHYNTLLVWLDEIVRPKRGPIARQYGEVGFDPRRFRPVQPRKTDISVFEALLHTNKHKEPAQ